jgi:hypothetical protein
MSVEQPNETNKIAEEIGETIEKIDEVILPQGRIPFWPAFIALAVVGLLFSLLSERLTIGPSWSILLIVGILLIPAVIGWLRYFHRVNRIMGRLITAIVTLAQIVSVVLLVVSLLAHTITGLVLLEDAAILWVINIIVFGLWYWELDGGGPGQRHLHGYKPSDFVFPQLAFKTPATKNWSPGLIDYVYLAFNTNTAFSPTDTAVLSRRAKVLMMLQSVIALVVLAMLAARAINIIPSGS